MVLQWLKSDSAIITRCSRSRRSASLIALKVISRTWKSQICSSLQSVHRLALAEITVFKASNSVPVCYCFVNVFIQPCDTGSTVSHACLGCLQCAPVLRAFRQTPGTILGLLRLDLTGCGQFVFFVFVIFVVQSSVWLFLYSDRCSREAALQ